MISIEWQPMSTAPRDGSHFVVKHVSNYQGREDIEPLIVCWDEYADSEGGWWLEEGAVIHYETCAGWFPIPEVK